MRASGIALTLLLGATGCTAAHARVSGTADAGLAAPGPDLAGTWRATAFAVPGSAHLVSTPVQLEITPTGTWAWTSGDTTKATGTVRRDGGRVVLQAAPSKGPAGLPGDAIQLQHGGDHLWGVSRYFIPGAQSAVDLRRQETRP